MIVAASAAVAVALVYCMYPAGQEVDVILNHVKSFRRCRELGNPVHPYHPVASARQLERKEEPARPAVVRLGALARLAGAYVFRDVDVLAHPEGAAANQRPRLCSSEVAPKRSVVALVSTCAHRPPPAGMQRRSASPCRYRRPQRTRNVPPFGVLAGMPTGDP